MKHPKLKLIALLCATAIWFYVALDNTYQINMSIPIKIKGLSKNLAITNDIPKTISIELEGKGHDLILNNEDLGYIELNLVDSILGEKIYVLNKSNFITKHKNIINFNRFLGDKNIKVVFDTRIHKQVPIKSNISLETKDNYVIVGNPKIVPPMINISGGRSQLTKVYEVITEDLNFSMLANDTNISLYLIPIPGINLSQDSVQLEIKVQPLQQIKLDNIPVKLVGVYNHDKYFLKDPTTSISISAGTEIINQIKAENINVYIEFSRFSIEGNNLKPSLNIPYTVKSFLIDDKLYQLDSNIVDTTITQTDSSKNIIEKFNQKKLKPEPNKKVAK